MKVGGGKRSAANVMPKVDRVVSREGGCPQPTKDLGTVVISPAGSRAKDPLKNEFGVFYACQERGFDDVLFNLRPLGNAGLRDAQY